MVKVHQSFVDRAVEKVVASKSHCFLDPIHKLPLVAPAVLCKQ